MLVQNSFGVLVAWGMVIISSSFRSDYLHRTGVSRWITSSMSSLTPLCHEKYVPTGFVLSGLRIYLETASIFSGPGQTPQMYPKKRSLWTIPTRILSSTLPLCGFVTLVLGTSEGPWCPRLNLKHR